MSALNTSILCTSTTNKNTNELMNLLGFYF